MQWADLDWILIVKKERKKQQHLLGMILVLWLYNKMFLVFRNESLMDDY